MFSFHGVSSFLWRLSEKQGLERLKAGRGLPFLSGAVNAAVGPRGPQLSSGLRSTQGAGESSWHVGTLAPWFSLCLLPFPWPRSLYGSVGSEEPAVPFGTAVIWSQF